eukprot:13676831-Ditylum_brightwellii.AAC.1
MSIVDFYKTNKESAKHRNGVARLISPGEIQAVIDGFDWKSLSGKTIVDVGGGYGDMMNAIAKKFPNIKCLCMDLPEVIAAASPPPSSPVKLVGGDMFESIPPCDVVFMKHVFCDWSDEDSVKILQSCNLALPPEGK